MVTARSDSVHADLLTSRPLYKEVKSRVIQSLIEGKWRPGVALPSESKLAALYQVGIATIRAAIGELVAARVLIRRQGKGTFVSVHNQQRNIYQFFHVVRDDGIRQLPVSELVSLKKGKADGATAELLRIARGASSEIFKLRNVLRVGGEPVVLSDIVIPALLFPGLSETVIREGSTLYAVYHARYGINIIRTVEKLRAVKADAAAGKLFKLAPDDPVLEIQRVAYTFNDVPVEVRRSRVLTKNYHYLLDQGGTD